MTPWFAYHRKAATMPASPNLSAALKAADQADKRRRATTSTTKITAGPVRSQESDLPLDTDQEDWQAAEDVRGMQKGDTKGSTVMTRK